MRPVQKWVWPTDANNNQKNYNPHTIAKTDLENNLGCFCSYCEVFSSDLEVEHVISQNQSNLLTHNWDNFLLSCGRCNGRDNKTNKPVNLPVVHFPHINNTFLSFEYLEGGLVRLNAQLTDASKTHAEALLDLVCLDKYPGNPKYPNLNPNDTRWKHRRTAWEQATRKLSDYQNNTISAIDVVDYAKERGFFSVWYSVFFNYPDVKKALISEFTGTAVNCFDSTNNFNPIPRNPNNKIDQI